MKWLLAVLLWSSVAFCSTRPLDRVYAYAGNHKVTVRVDRGVYWVEMEGSDVFGVGPSVDDAAEDFMMDADLEAHESGRPSLTVRHWKAPFVCGKYEVCI